MDDGKLKFWIFEVWVFGWKIKIWIQVKSKILGSITGGDGGSGLCVYEIFKHKRGWNQQSISKGNKVQMMACLYIFQLWKLSTQFTDYLLSSAD